MALPTLTKTYQFDVNNRVASTGGELTMHQDIMFQIKSMLIGYGTLPWTVVGSSDSSAASMDGTDRWTTSSDLVWSTGSRSWIVLQNNLGVQMCIDLNDSSSTPQQIEVYLSLSAGFSGGSTSARPTATDEFRINRGPTDRYFTGNDTTGSDDVVIHGWHATDGTVDRIYIYRNNICVGAWELEEILNPRTNHTVAYVGGVRSDSSDNEMLNNSNLNDSGWRIYESATEIRVGLTSEGFNSTWLNQNGNAAVAEEFDNEHFFVECGWFGITTGGRGPKGRRPDIWMGQYQITNTGDTYPSDNTKQFVAMESIVLPWDGTSVMETI